VTHEVESAIRFDKVLSVDKAGPDCACIKLIIGYPPNLYTDVLSMLRIAGRWCENAYLLRHFMLKTIILPRQARDNIGKTQKTDAFSYRWIVAKSSDHEIYS
jgi:hypothetical protein